MDILATLQAEKDNLSRSEQRIAALLFEDTGFAVNASIIELASRAEVSPPTVTRFCRRLGCQSYSEFKVRLAQSTFVGIRYLQSETKLASAAEVADMIVERAQSALYAMHGALDIPVIEKAAKSIAGAGMVYAFGSGGNSSMIAEEIQNRLFRLGLRVTTSADHGMQLMMAAAARTDDVVIASSLSGRNLELARALTVARDYKVTTIAMTRPQSPVADAAALVLPIDLAEGTNILRPTSGRYAFLAMVDILATLVAIRRESTARETLRRVKHQMVTFRDRDDKEVLGD
jgi:DNA-binding MurR/RpiR family transcriptional regulator